MYCICTPIKTINCCLFRDIWGLYLPFSNEPKIATNKILNYSLYNVLRRENSMLNEDFYRLNGGGKRFLTCWKNNLFERIAFLPKKGSLFATPIWLVLIEPIWPILIEDRKHARQGEPEWKISHKIE